MKDRSERESGKGSLRSKTTDRTEDDGGSPSTLKETRPSWTERITFSGIRMSRKRGKR